MHAPVFRALHFQATGSFAHMPSCQANKSLAILLPYYKCSSWLVVRPVFFTHVRRHIAVYRFIYPQSVQHSINRPWQRYTLPNHAHIQLQYDSRPFQRLLSCETVAMPVRLPKSNAVRRNRHAPAAVNVVFRANTL